VLQGHVHPDFAAVARTLRSLIPEGRPGGAAASVYHRGECVVDIWGGTRDAEGRPWEADTVSLSYSTTKGVTSTLLHRLVDQGLLDYDDSVSKYWPEFSQAGKGEVTIRQLMCHEAGLYHIRWLIDDAIEMLDWDHMTATLAAAAPIHAPGTAHGYHALTYGWLVGEVAQRVTGRSFGELIRSEIAEPLGLDGLFVGVPEGQLHRRARLIPPKERPEGSMQRMRPRLKRVNAVLQRIGAPLDLAQMAAALAPHGFEDLDMNSDAVTRACIPAANGMFTARSLARMYAALAGGGELDGERLLSAETIERASSVQNRGRGRVIPMRMHWRLGYHRIWGMRARFNGAFGHFGYGGSGAFADPRRNLSVALVLNSGVGTPFGDARMVRIGSAAARCADRR
jgi:CubicO group peptidase (beta-lactamase class C family)